MRDHADAFSRSGANVYVVTTGTPADTADFCRERNVPFACLVDRPGEPAYQAFGLRKVGLRKLFGPSLVRGVLTALERWREVSLPRSGDVYQMSGTFVLDGAATVRLAHVDEHPNDHAAASEVLGCLATIA